MRAYIDAKEAELKSVQDAKTSLEEQLRDATHAKMDIEQRVLTLEATIHSNQEQVRYHRCCLQLLFPHYLQLIRVRVLLVRFPLTFALCVCANCISNSPCPGNEDIAAVQDAVGKQRNLLSAAAR